MRLTSERATFIYASSLTSLIARRSATRCTRAISYGLNLRMSTSTARDIPCTPMLSTPLGNFTTLIILAIVPTIYISFSSGSSTSSSRCATSSTGCFAANAASTAARDFSRPTSSRTGSPGNTTMPRSAIMGSTSVPSGCGPNSMPLSGPSWPASGASGGLRALQALRRRPHRSPAPGPAPPL